MKTSRILTTGGTGFLGRHVQQAFKDSGHEIWFPSSRELDLLDRDCIEKSSHISQTQSYILVLFAAGFLPTKQVPPISFTRMSIWAATFFMPPNHSNNLVKKFPYIRSEVYVPIPNTAPRPSKKAIYGMEVQRKQTPHMERQKDCC